MSRTAARRALGQCAHHLRSRKMKLAAYRPAHSYDQLSLRDLLDARDLYHIHLMQHRNVVATAVGRYRIRQKDSWPNEKGDRKGSWTTRGRSRIRKSGPTRGPPSWSSLSSGKTSAAFCGQGGRVRSRSARAKTLYLPDGRARAGLRHRGAEGGAKRRRGAPDALPAQQHRRRLSGDRRCAGPAPHRHHRLPRQRRTQGVRPDQPPRHWRHGRGRLFASSAASWDASAPVRPSS